MAWTPLALTAGIASDDTPLALEGRFRDTSNVHFRKGKAQITAGWERLTTQPITGACRGLMTWKDTAGSTLVALGTHTSLYAYRSGAMADITPASLAPGLENGSIGPGYGIGLYGVGAYGTADVVGDYFPRTWAMANWGLDLLALPRGGRLLWWKQDITADAIYVPNAPARAGYMLVTPQRQVLLFNTNEELSGVLNPMAIRGSDLEDLTVWTNATNNNAFEHILEGSGQIVAARNFGAGVIVWTETRCFLGTFIGDPGQTYRFDELHGAPGLLAPGAAVVLGDSVWWLTPDRLLFTLLVNATTPTQVNIPIFDDSIAHLSETQKDKVIVSYSRPGNELRIDYPDERLGRENNSYLLLSLSDGAWSRGEQARSAFDVGITNPIGVQPVANVTPNVAFDYSFLASQTHGASAVGATLAATPSGLLLTSMSSNPQLLISPPAPFDGSDTYLIEVDVQRTVARSSGAWLGEALYKTPAHVEGSGYRSQNAPDLAVGERRTVVFDMTNLFAGGDDWTSALISRLRLDLDGGPDGALLIRSIRVYGADTTATTTSLVYLHERGNSADGGAISWSVETNYFTLDEGDTRMVVRGFKPDFKDQQGVAWLTLYAKDETGDDSPETEIGPFQVAPGQSRVDFLASGKLMRFSVSGMSAPAALRFGKPMFDLVEAGGR